MVAHVRGRERPRRSALRMASIVVAGMLGGALGMAVPLVAGLSISADARRVVAGIAAVVVVVFSMRQRRPWQFDVETPTAWLRYPEPWPALANGSALGFAYLSRLGYWLAWLLPLAGFAVGGVGALAIGALYGAARLGGSVLLLARPFARRRPSGPTAQRWASAALVGGGSYLVVAAVLAVT